jgi:hypothetical protein
LGFLVLPVLGFSDHLTPIHESMIIPVSHSMKETSLSGYRQGGFFYLADGSYSVILDQVANGIAVRMAVQSLLIGASRGGDVD